MQKQSARRFMFAGGVLEVAVMAIHLAWPIQIAGSREFTTMAPAYQDLLLLAILAIGFSLGIVGALSIYLSGRLGDGDVSVSAFCASQGILWLARLFLELRFPVRVPLFIILEPTLLIAPLCAVVALLFLVPAWICRDEFSRAHRLPLVSGS